MERLKVLVVDDESRMRKLVKDFLDEEKDFEVLEAGDGDGSDGYFLCKRRILRLIILDVMMPKMDGWQVCREDPTEYSQGADHHADGKKR